MTVESAGPYAQVCTSLQTDNQASTPPLSFLPDGCPSCRPTNSVKALKAKLITDQRHEYLFIHTATTTVQPFNGLFSRTIWVSRYKKGKTRLTGFWGGSGISWTICKQSASHSRYKHTNTSSLNFYRPAALPDEQPTVSKH